MVCPRCGKPLEVLTLPTDARDVELDGCRGCRGVWIDGVELEHVVPALAHGVETESHKRWTGQTLPKCPRCAGKDTTVFHFRGIWVDHCRACRGVWLDGHEHQGLWERVRTAAQFVRTYRDAPPSAPKVPTVRCFACRATVPQAETLVTGRGPLCTGCVRARLASSTASQPRLCATCAEVHPEDDLGRPICPAERAPFAPDS